MPKNRHAFTLSLWLSSTALAFPVFAADGLQPWLDNALAPHDRAVGIVGAMTLDEKLSLLQGDTVLDANGTGVNPCVGHISGIPRLGLPSLCMGDGPAGVGNGLKQVTQFPAPIAGAASWNIDLMQRYGQALGSEHAAKGRNVVLAPTINIIRTPKWGRMAETLSEDPWLTAHLGVAITNGIQSVGVIATPKHFVANNQEWLRLGDGPAYTAIDAKISQRALHEIYYPGFKAVVTKAHAGSVMCAYNQVNGHYACENPDTLNVLRQDWGFDGFVVADWYFAHRSTVPSVKAGLDISMPGGVSPFGFAEFYGPPLRQTVLNGAVSLSDIDGMVTRIVEPMFRLGLVDKPIKGTADSDARSPEHTALAEEIALQGTVLLRNEHQILPLQGDIKTLAIIGDDAGPHVQTTERYGGFVKSEDILPVAPVTPLDAITKRAGAGVKVTYAPGTLGIGALPVVPSDVLRPLAGQAHGLTATYYASPDFNGRPVVVRTEAKIDQAGPTVDGLPGLWSARWEGSLIPPKDGVYRFSLTGGGEIRLTIDGKVVAYTPKQNFRLVTHGSIRLTGAKPVSIKLEYSTAPTLSPAELRLGWEAPDNSQIEAAVEAARRADVAIVFVADHVSEGADRTDLKLPGDQDALIEAVAKANPRTVVVLHTVGPVLMPWRDKVAGIFSGWYAGEQSGAAIASLLFGDANPSGKLPVTFPAETHGPADTADRYPGIGTTVHYDEDILVGYRWYDQKGVNPLYPFGFGLSYTQFDYSDLKVERAAAGQWRVHVKVTNRGTRAGSDVAQLYVGMPKAADEPPVQLKGFQRLSLTAGASADASFTLDADDLKVWDSKSGAARLPEGVFQIKVGHSSRDLPLSAVLDPAA